jgi:3-isopropylmalate/(R)-2-methylmalate dehydratase small subunit
MSAGPRFGIGSSREHAVWALMDFGFQAIIAPSFGDIFQNNAAKQGLVIVRLSTPDVEELTQLVKDEPTRLVVVDVEHLRVEVPESGWQRQFTLDRMTQQRLLNGWDDIGLTERRQEAITTYETTSLAPTLEGIFDDAGHVR